MEKERAVTYYSRQAYGEGRLWRPLKAWHETV